MHTSNLFNFALTVSLLAGATEVAADEPQGNSRAANKLIGTWKLVSARYGGKEAELPRDMTRLKHVTPTHSLWVNYGKDGKVNHAAGGTYTLKGEEYAESPEYGVGVSFDSVSGRTHVFKCKIDGNSWYHTGKLAGGLEIEEVWERVEK